MPVEAERPRISGMPELLSGDTCVGQSAFDIFSDVRDGVAGSAVSPRGGSLVQDDVRLTATRLRTTAAHEAHTLQGWHWRGHADSPGTPAAGWSDASLLRGVRREVRARQQAALGATVQDRLPCRWLRLVGASNSPFDHLQRTSATRAPLLRHLPDPSRSESHDVQHTA